MSVIWALLIGKVILCAVAGAPTLFFVRSGGWFRKSYGRRVQRRLRTILATLSANFRNDEGSFADGVGLAEDF